VAGTSKRRHCRNFGRCVAAILANTVSTEKTAFALFRQGFATSFRPTARNAGEKELRQTYEICDFPTLLLAFEITCFMMAADMCAAFRATRRARI
jgi:hypothetical protein